MAPASAPVFVVRSINAPNTIATRNNASTSGAIRSDLGPMAAAVASLLGGIVVWGSNSSTAKEAMNELAAAESQRAALIEHINPRVIS